MGVVGQGSVVGGWRRRDEARDEGPDAAVQVLAGRLDARFAGGGVGVARQRRQQRQAEQRRPRFVRRHEVQILADHLAVVGDQEGRIARFRAAKQPPPPKKKVNGDW